MKNRLLFASLVSIFSLLLILAIVNFSNFFLISGLDNSTPEGKYQTALELAKNGKYSEALQNLPENVENYNHRLFELRGDILFAQNENADTIKTEYEKSLSLVDEPRVHEKIALLDDKKPENTETNHTEQGQMQKSPEVQEAEKQILEDQARRQEFLNLSNSSELLDKNMQNIRNILSDENTQQIKDW